MATFVSRKGPNGRRVWQAKIRRRGYPPQSGTFDSKAKAETWARLVESEMDRGAFIPRTDAEGTTLSEMLDRYEHEVTSHKRGKGETSIIKWWRESDLACRSMARIRGKDVADTIRNKEGEGVGPKTIVAHLALLRHLFTIARKEWGMESLGNPVEMVRKPKLPQGRTRRLEDGEESRLIEAARAYGGEIQHLIPWAIETAMRRGEIAAMRWEHLDRKVRVLLIPETKTGTPRRVPLSSKALQVLDTLPRQIGGSVWSMRPDSISQAFERVCKAAGIEGLTFHDLRHEATSRLFEKGLKPMEVAAITGHKTLQMLKRYTHLRAEDLVERLG